MQRPSWSTAGGRPAATRVDWRQAAPTRARDWRSYSSGQSLRLAYGRNQPLVVPTIGALVKPRIQPGLHR